MEKLLAAMQEEVIGANGMEGGHVHGREGVRSYWTRQWAMIDPHVEPVEFSKGPQGEIIVEVHQIVRDLNGTLLTDKLVGHVFRLERGWSSVISAARDVQRGELRVNVTAMRSVHTPPNPIEV